MKKYNSQLKYKKYMYKKVKKMTLLIIKPY